MKTNLAVIDGKPVSFSIDASYTLEEGLEITIEWFKEHMG